MKRYPNLKLMLFVLALGLLAVTFGRLPQMRAAVAVRQACTMNPVVSNDGGFGTGTLRQAVIDACPGSTITFDINVTGTILLSGGQITVDKNLTIQGPGANLLTVKNLASQSATSRVFLVNAGVTATISGLTITGGNLISDYGGGLYNNGTLTVNYSTIANNAAVGGGSNDYATGGGVYNNGTLTVNHSTIANNLGRRIDGFGDGGGISNSEGSTVTVNHSTISNNSAGNGGGIFNSFGGIVTVTNSTISNNSSTSLTGGGGILNGGTVTATNSTINDNNAYSAGGGIYNLSGSVTLTNSTISSNQVGGVQGSKGGGGLYNQSSNGIVTLTHSTISNNRALAPATTGGIRNSGSFNCRNSIIAGNAGFDFFGTLTSQGYNLIGNTGLTTIVGDTTGNILNQSALLGPLQNNGGPTQTQALLPGSPAIDAGADTTTLNGAIDNSTTTVVLTDASPFPAVNGFVVRLDNEQMIITGKAGNTLTVTRGTNSTTAAAHNNGAGVSPAFDQRGLGFPRKVGSAVDIGAHEFDPLNTTPTISAAPGSLAFGSVTVANTSPPQTVTISNTGSGDLHIGTVTTTGAGAADYTILNSPSGATITPGNNAQFTVKFAPTTTGSRPATINIASDDPATPTATVTLSGVGVLNPACTMNPVVTNDGNSGGGTLRQAVMDACPGSTITFADYVTGTIFLQDGQITIDKDLTIQGPGANLLTVKNLASQSPTSRVFLVNAGVTVTISGLTITGGNISGYGGGILNNGTLTVNNSTIANNAAAGGGAGGGAGIYNNGTLTLNHSTITNNSGERPDGFGGGGGIYSNGPLNVTNSTIANNVANNGGGIYNFFGGTVTVTNSTISNNSAVNGAGLNNFRGTMTVINSTISSNTASGIIGGGGILNDGTSTVTNSTINNNSSPTGGGLYNSSGTMTVTNSTISSNIASGSLGSQGGGGIRNSGSFNCRNSIIAGNSGFDFFGTLTSQGYNLIGNTSLTTIVGDTTGNILNQNALLGPLQNNGGPTQTQALLPGSPAIDKGSAVAGVTADQRGLSRPADDPAIPNAAGGNGSDIGAYEVQAAACPTITGTLGGGGTICAAQSANVAVTVSGGVAPYTVTLTNGGGTQTGNGPMFTFSMTPGATTSYQVAAGSHDANNCPLTNSGTATVNVNQPPTTATVGGTQTICALGTTSGLGGNTPTTGTGMWSVVSGGTGTFNPNATTPNATFTHTTGAGPVVLRWTISNGICPTSTANVTITINQPPTTATVGPNQNLVLLGMTVGLGGNTPAVGTGTWSVVNGGTGTFNPNATTPNATFTHTGGAGPILLRWTITNPPCSSSAANLTLTLNQSPVVNPVPVSVQAGSSAATRLLATVSDDQTPVTALTAQVNGAASAAVNGVTVSGLTINAAGQLQGQVVAACGATTPAVFTLNVTDSTNATTNATLTLTVTSNPGPALSYAAPPSVVVGNSLTVNPATGPSDNGNVASLALQSVTPAFSGTVNVASPSGAVTISNAAPVGSFTVVIRVTDNCGVFTDAPFTLNVTCPTITVNPASLPNATINTAYPTTLGATPAGGSYSFAVTSGLLPAGLTLNSNGSFSGAPTQSGVFNFRVTATSFGVCSGFRDYVLTVECPGVTLNPASLPGGTVGTAYSQTVSATPAGSYSYNVTSGALPTGLTLNAATGALTGNPTQPGAFSFSLTATAGACAATRSYSVTIGCAGITLAALGTATVGTSYSGSVAASPSDAYTYALVTGSLPAGLTLNASTGALTGMPGSAGTYNFTLKSQTANGCSGQQSYTLVVDCPAITLAALPTPALNAAYSQTVTATPTGGGYVYTLSSGVLPASLALNVATGQVSGTPTVAGAYGFTLTATGFGTCTGSRTYTGTIAGGGCPTITLPALPDGGLGQLYTNSVTATPSGSYSYAVTSGSLPPGLTLYGSIGLLYGYPTAAGTYNFTVTATDSNNCTGSKSYNLVIGGAASSLRASAVFGDFDGDGKADLSVWRGQAGEWLTLNSGTSKLQSEQWGTSAAPYYDVMTPGDFDGDGKMDLAVFRRSTGEWWIKGSKDGAVVSQAWGMATDTPVPGDYDGDGKTDIAVWRGADTNWYILRSSDHQTQIISWGTSRAPYRDVPVPADYDGDGKTDIAVFRQANGHWYIRQSSDGQVIDKYWGLGTDVPVPADYDGDGKADIAVWRGADTNWYIVQSSDGAVQTTSWGGSWLGDVPVAGDYDGDGKTDIAVWRATEGKWCVKLSRDESVITKAHGQTGDVPVAANHR